MTEVPDYDVLVVGAGHAGAQVVIELLTAGFPGRIGMVTREHHEPYEKPPLTKGYLNGTLDQTELALRPSAFWQRPKLDLILGTTITTVDPEAKSVVAGDGSVYHYGRLVWAAGGDPRRLPVPGADLDGVHELRTLDDAVRYKEAMATSTQAVIIGAGFIGLEAAAAFAGPDRTVTVVESQGRVLARVTCETVSAFFTERHEREGVRLLLDTQVEELLGEAGRVTGVRISSGAVLPADTVLVAVGLVPHVGPLAEAGAACSNGIEVDRFTRTSLPDVYAVGDCTLFPFDQVPQGQVRLESLQNAVEQGKVAARHILGVAEPYTVIPWFWSTQYDVKFKTVGIAVDHQEVVIRGDVAQGRFSAVYLRDGRVCAVDSVNQMKEYVDAHTVVGEVVDRDLLADASVRLKECVVGLQPAAPAGAG